MRQSSQLARDVLDVDARMRYAPQSASQKPPDLVDGGAREVRYLVEPSP